MGIQLQGQRNGLSTAVLRVILFVSLCPPAFQITDWGQYSRLCHLRLYTCGPASIRNRARLYTARGGNAQLIRLAGDAGLPSALSLTVGICEHCFRIIINTQTFLRFPYSRASHIASTARRYRQRLKQRVCFDPCVAREQSLQQIAHRDFGSNESSKAPTQPRGTQSYRKAMT